MSLTIEVGAASTVSVRISKDTNLGQFNDTIHAADLGPTICAELIRAEATNTAIDPTIKDQIRAMVTARVQAWKDFVKYQQDHPYIPTKAEKIEAANNVCDAFEVQLDFVLNDPGVIKAECRTFKNRLQLDLDKIQAVIDRLTA